MSSIATKLGVVIGAGVIAMGVLALRSSPDELREETATGNVDHPKAATSDLRSVSYPAPDTSQSEFEDALRRGDVGSMSANVARGASATGQLSAAIATGKVDVVRFVLDHENITDDTDDTSLFEAEGHPAIAKLLLARGVPEVSLHDAVANHAINAVTRILAKPTSKRDLASGLEALADNYSGQGAKRVTMANALFAAGADVTSVDASLGGSMMSRALSSCGDGGECDTVYVKLLADHGARLGASDLEVAMSSPTGRPLLDALASAKLECNALAEVKESGPYDAAQLKALDRLSKLRRSADCAAK